MVLLPNRPLAALLAVAHSMNSFAILKIFIPDIGPETLNREPAGRCDGAVN
jgi:hypothetical protein